LSGQGYSRPLPAFHVPAFWMYENPVNAKFAEFTFYEVR
jgi:hypothetical protein